MGTRIGEMPCPNKACTCADVAVEKTGAGTLQLKCHKCGFSAFAKAGTKWRRDVEAAMTLDDEPGDPAPPEPGLNPLLNKPPAKRPASVFSLDDLS